MTFSFLVLSICSYLNFSLTRASFKSLSLISRSFYSNLSSYSSLSSWAASSCFCLSYAFFAIAAAIVFFISSYCANNSKRSFLYFSLASSFFFCFNGSSNSGLLYSSSISAATFYLNCSETSFWVSSFCPCSLSIFCFLSSAFRIFSLSSLFSSSSSFCSVSFLFLSYFNKVSCFASSIDRIISASRWIFRYSFSSY